MVGYVRQTDIDGIRSEELVLKLASTQGCVRRRDVVELLRIEPPRAYRLLRKLVDAGKLELEGSGRAASYRVKT
jgi:ATP-dependent DNA helicase RecG